MKPGNSGGGKGPQFKVDVRRGDSQEIGLNPATPERVGKLQAALHTKAKEAPEYRFYVLYDKLCREDVLAYAYKCCRANGGASGVDGQGFADIESYGLERWLGELTEELKGKTYRPSAVRRVYIPKPDGKQRPLGIPTIRDRVVQMAAVLVLDPIFEVDLQPEQYAYRHGRSALDAVQAVHGHVNRGHLEVVEGDLRGYFDSVPHAELMKSVARRVSDRHMLHLVKMWLVAPVEEVDAKGRRTRTTRSKDEGRGTPQGSPISPLLSNIYMRRFVLGWKALGYEQRYDAHIVNFADDYVICCRGTAKEVLVVMQKMMVKLKLTVNEAKTRVCRVPAESFDFLGYTIGRCWSVRTGRPYIGTRPARARLVRIRREISAMTDRRWLLLDPGDRVRALNRLLIGWANYFTLGPVGKAYRAVDLHARYRLRQWLRRKYKVSGSGFSRFPTEYLYKRLGLVKLATRTRNFPCAVV